MMFFIQHFQVMSGSMSFDNLSSLMSTSTSFSSDLNLNSELNPARGRSSTNTTGSSQAQGNQISITGKAIL